MLATSRTHAATAGFRPVQQRLHDSDAETVDRLGAGEVEPQVCRIGVAEVEAGDHSEDCADIRDRASERPHSVQRPAHRLHAAVRDRTVGRPKPGDAAQGGRQPDRAAGVRADRRDAKVGCNGRTRAAARAAGDPVRSGGVDHVPKRLIARRRSEGELVHVRLAEDHRACGTKTPRHLGVCRRRPGRRTDVSQP